MKAILAIFLQFVRGDFRDRYALFWNLAFPLLLLTILTLVFGNMMNPDTTISFRVGFVNDGTSEGTFSASEIIEEVFLDLSAEEGNWLTLYISSDKEKGLQEELRELEKGNRHAVLFIPENFDTDVEQSIRSAFFPRIPKRDGGTIQIYVREEDQVSVIAFDVLRQILNEINTQMNQEVGLVDTTRLASMVHHQVDGLAQEGFNFGDYLLPGIILMVFLSSGLEILVERLAQHKERGILKRYFATPLRPIQYGFGLLLHIVALSLVQVLLLYSLSVIVFGVKVPLFSPLPFFYMVFSLITLLSLGLLIASVSKTANAAGSLANALLYPLMFLGGLYFPVGEMPFPISIFVRINPVTYLINGFRESLSVFPSATPGFLNLLVPIVWILVALTLGFTRFRFDVEGGKS